MYLQFFPSYLFCRMFCHWSPMNHQFATMFQSAWGVWSVALACAAFWFSFSLPVVTSALVGIQVVPDSQPSENMVNMTHHNEKKSRVDSVGV